MPLKKKSGKKKGSGAGKKKGTGKGKKKGKTKGKSKGKKASAKEKLPPPPVPNPFSYDAMLNAYYIAHGPVQFLEFRGYSWSGGAGKKKKKGGGKKKKKK